MSRGWLVHYAAPDDEKTACGKIALEPDGTRHLETDLDLENQVTCKRCLARANSAKK